MTSFSAFCRSRWILAEGRDEAKAHCIFGVKRHVVLLSHVGRVIIDHPPGAMPCTATEEIEGFWATTAGGGISDPRLISAAIDVWAAYSMCDSWKVPMTRPSPKESIVDRCFHRLERFSLRAGFSLALWSLQRLSSLPFFSTTFSGCLFCGHHQRGWPEEPLPDDCGID